MSHWQLTDDVHLFADQALPLLQQDPVANTIALSILDWLLAGRAFSEATPVFAWYVDDVGLVAGAYQGLGFTIARS
ncbi:hypothetical protein acdb102_29440 [Acidothermaceae bacterium B102]|nr:hypothetical protein acdb102_29440 [Acidothermaceae bacterium B102]